MDFLDLQNDEMNELEKSYQEYGFPVVTFHRYGGRHIASFNKHAQKTLCNYSRVKIYANAEYVVFQPSDKNDWHAYCLNHTKVGGCTTTCKEFGRLMLQGKAYKLYNTKKGFAIKRNEPLKQKVSE